MATEKIIIISDISKTGTIRINQLKDDDNTIRLLQTQKFLDSDGNDLGLDEWVTTIEQPWDDIPQAIKDALIVFQTALYNEGLLQKGMT